MKRDARKRFIIRVFAVPAILGAMFVVAYYFFSDKPAFPFVVTFTAVVIGLVPMPKIVGIAVAHHRFICRQSDEYFASLELIEVFQTRFHLPVMGFSLVNIWVIMVFMITWLKSGPFLLLLGTGSMSLGLAYISFVKTITFETRALAEFDKKKPGLAS